MLSKVFLFVNTFDKPEGLIKLVENLQKQKVEVQMISKELLNDSFDIFNAISIEQTLVISDNSLVCDYLTARGYCVAAYLHDGNRHESFSMISYIIEGFEELDYEYLSYIYSRSCGSPLTILETDRCILREITIEDVDSLYDLYANPLVTQYIEPLYKDREREIAYTKDYIKNIYGFYGYGLWIVCLKDSGTIIGRAGLEQREGMDGLELGFVFGVPFQKQGYAYEVCKAIVAYSKEKLEQLQLYALIKSENHSSIQ
ncbi:MAG: GNAT family N-acetyltransferase, partial [Clostridiales bacterium]|nr:GNAT family N-acetyltransferase [Clostridiales bacterium]